MLSVHHLRAERKRDLFRRVREQSRALVIGDVVEADEPVTPIEAGFDFPERAADLAEWSGGEVVWEADDLAVIRADVRSSVDFGGLEVLVAAGEAVAAALHGGEELLQVDLEGRKDLVGVVLGAQADLALGVAGVLEDLLGARARPACRPPPRRSGVPAGRGPP